MYPYIGKALFKPKNIWGVKHRKKNARRKLFHSYMCTKSTETSLFWEELWSILEKSANSCKLTRTQKLLGECQCVHVHTSIEGSACVSRTVYTETKHQSEQKHCCRFWSGHIVQLLSHRLDRGEEVRKEGWGWGGNQLIMSNTEILHTFGRKRNDHIYKLFWE